MSRIDNNDKHIKHAVNKIKEDANQLLLVEFHASFPINSFVVHY